MADLTVDVDGLESLTSTIRDIQARLNDTKDLIDDTRGAIGSGTVCDALDHFQSHWKDGRKHINKNADTMASMLSDSVSAYRKTDEDLNNSLQTNTTTQQVGGGGSAQ